MLVIYFILIILSVIYSLKCPLVHIKSRFSLFNQQFEGEFIDNDYEGSFKAPTYEIDRRRNFAIISHPDAGKTTLTEKLLLFGGAIQDAGAVKARADQRKATSDWMEIE